MSDSGATVVASAMRKVFAGPGGKPLAAVDGI